jgi:hypothetical protein
MRLSVRPGETNVPAIILSVAVLIICLAGAYYLIAVVPAQQSNITIDEDSLSSSPSSVSSVMQQGGTTGTSTTSTASSKVFDQAAYDACINAATEAHNQRWAAMCTQKKENQHSLYLACVNKGNTEEYCKTQFPYEDISSSCTLSVSQTNALNVQYAAAKQSCNKQYGL